MTRDERLTELLQAAAEGEPRAFEEVAERVYRELERVARGQMRARYGRDLAGVTLEPSALVNDTLLKLLDRPREYENRRHFYAYATKVMLRVLLDYQRRRGAAKRGGDQVRVTLAGVVPADREGVDVAALAEALDELEALDPRKAEVVRLKIFWGLPAAEIATTVDVSIPTVERDWRFARSWLAAALAT